MPKRKLQAMLTKECMERIMAGETERIDVDADTVLEIKRSEKFEKTPSGYRGQGLYLLVDQEPPDADREK